MRILLTIIFILSFFEVTHSQYKKFGKIEKADFIESLSKEDSSSSALVLFKSGEYKIDNELKFVIEYHIRIKVLNDEGVSYANIELPFYKSYEQEIESIEGRVYNLNEKGKIEKEKLNKKEIYEEAASEKLSLMKFTLPKVKSGSIFEYKYLKRVEEPSQIPDWEFDELIPVKWSKLVAEIPTFLRYSIVKRTSDSFFIEKRESSSSRFKISYTPESGTYASLSRRTLDIRAESEIFTFVMKDLPALKREPYISSIHNHTNKLFFFLSALDIPGQVYEEYAVSWDSYIEKWLSVNNHESLFTSEPWARKVVDDLKLAGDKKEQIRRIYDHIGSFNWTNEVATYTTKKIESVYKSKFGNSADLNLLLIKILRAANINASPVLLSTRSNGKVNRKFVLPHQLNHTIAFIELENESFFLDVTSPFKTSILPSYNLNGHGLIVQKGAVNWVKLKNQERSSKEIKYEMKLDKSGNISGKVEVSASGIDGLLMGQAFEKGETTDFLVDSYFKGQDVKFDSLTVVLPDFFENDFKLSFLFTYLLDESLKEVNYLKLPYYRLKENNIFYSSVRKYPIEIPYYQNHRVIVNLNIPEGFSFQDIPISKTITINGVNTNFTLDYFRQSDRRITMEKRILLLEEIITVQSYRDIKSIFNEASKSSLNLVVKKN